ncbi:MAG: hypothetical protein PHW69_07565, partial [Elusimicrobiaceae bacterium]|nr:hypothetical protein [Elusimicrobiaceae bacterium]
MKRTLAVAGMLALLLPCAFAADGAAKAETGDTVKAEVKTAADKAAKNETAAEAAPGKDSGETSWFSEKLKVIKTRINRKMQSASVRNSAVAAVRGDKTDSDAMAPDWKGGDD